MEWKMLQENLPESIYVRAYENRIDLLRAVIIGNRGTPYHDGLFFFDIAFPSDYPNAPPLISYRSYGVGLNPNLYSSGRICLSILNTWIGSGCEKWDHSRSSVLQVLVSIQGLVLNEKPYYNEPWFRPARNWERYNEIAFGLSCKTMAHVLQNPPRNFKAFVNSHFRKCASSILKAIHAYKDGAFMAGKFEEDEFHPATKCNKVCRKFQKTLVDEYSVLFEHFSRIGAPVQHLKPPVLEKEVGIIDKMLLEKYPTSRIN